jgi:hypothetical protein
VCHLQVLHEVAEASDDEGEVGAASSKSGQRQATPRPVADSPLPPDQEAKRRAVLARLGADDSPPAAAAGSGAQGVGTVALQPIAWQLGLASAVTFVQTRKLAYLLT